MADYRVVIRRRRSNRFALRYTTKGKSLRVVRDEAMWKMWKIQGDLIGRIYSSHAGHSFDILWYVKKEQGVVSFLRRSAKMTFEDRKEFGI